MIVEIDNIKRQIKYVIVLHREKARSERDRIWLIVTGVGGVVSRQGYKVGRGGWNGVVKQRNNQTEHDSACREKSTRKCACP